MGGYIPIYNLVSLHVRRNNVSAALVSADTTADSFTGSMDRIYRSALCEYRNKSVELSKKQKVK